MSATRKDQDVQIGPARDQDREIPLTASVLVGFGLVLAYILALVLLRPTP